MRGDRLEADERRALELPVAGQRHPERADGRVAAEHGPVAALLGARARGRGRDPGRRHVLLQERDRARVTFLEQRCGVDGARGAVRSQLSATEANAGASTGSRGMLAAPPPPRQRSGQCAGCRTIFSQPSRLSLNIANPAGASASGRWCVITKLGSIAPSWMRSRSGRMYFCTWHCPALIVSDRFTTAPIGSLSTKPL